MNKKPFLALAGALLSGVLYAQDQKVDAPQADATQSDVKTIPATAPAESTSASKAGSAHLSAENSGVSKDANSADNKVEQQTKTVMEQAKEAINDVRAEQMDETERKHSLNELNYTVADLLKELVKGGVMTEDQAVTLVREAQAKALQEQKESGGVRVVRVPYIPEFVMDQLRGQVRAELRGDVVEDVIGQARQEGWAIPDALPSWVTKFKWKGDIRLRAEGDLLPNDNATGIPNYLVINDIGRLDTSNPNIFINSTTDRQRLRLRARLAMNANVSNNVDAYFRITTGNTKDPVSTNQTLGTYFNHYQVVWDRAYIQYKGFDADRYNWFTFLGGRTKNPWLHTNLVWDDDLSFEGVVATMRNNLRFGSSLYDQTENNRSLFLTLGAFPLQEVELSNRDKWLFGSQLGTDWLFDNQSRVKMAVGFYDFVNVTGVKNPPDSNIEDFTAPPFLQKGNTLFNIKTNSDPSSDKVLYALAADYRELNVTFSYDIANFSPTHVIIAADYVNNLGFNQDEVSQRVGSHVDAKTQGYNIQISVGWPKISKRRDWRVFGSYRYLERDAVMDAFTDSDFHLGGTDAKGWILGGDYGISDDTWLTLRWLTADSISGPPLAIDVVQLDLNAKF